MKDVYLTVFNAIYERQMTEFGKVDIAITKERFLEYGVGPFKTEGEGIEDLDYAILNIGMNATRDLFIDENGITGSFRIYGKVCQINLKHEDVIGFMFFRFGKIGGFLSPRYLFHHIPNINGSWLSNPISLLLENADKEIKEDGSGIADENPDIGRGTLPEKPIDPKTGKKPNPFKLVK